MSAAKKSEDFVLDPRLEADTALIANLCLSQLRLMGDSRWCWLVLVPRLGGASELIDLPKADYDQLMAEIHFCAQILKQHTKCDKLNIGALGNIVRQLHVHLIARHEGDENWPGPVWGFGKAEPYDVTTRNDIIAAFHAALGAANGTIND